MIKISVSNEKFFLENEFRNLLFRKAYERAGSLRQLGRKMGYSGPSPNYYVNRMWRGEQAITLSQLKVLSEIAHIPLDVVLQHAKKVCSDKK